MINPNTNFLVFKDTRPTLKEQVDTFHNIMHAFQLAQTCGNYDHVKEIIKNMENWSYAHRFGNGELSDKEQRQVVNKAFWKLKRIAESAPGGGGIGC